MANFIERMKRLLASTMSACDDVPSVKAIAELMAINIYGASVAASFIEMTSPRWASHRQHLLVAFAIFRGRPVDAMQVACARRLDALLLFR